MRLKAPPFLRWDEEAALRRSRDGRTARPDGRARPPLERAVGNRALGRLLRGGDAPAAGGDAGAAGPEQALEANGGRPLEPGVRGRMEGALGADLRDVRIHTDREAAAEVRRHGAEAMAIGSHVAFEQGRYRPGTPIGDALLAHELAHTVQQRDAARGPAPAVPRARLEADANRSALGAVGALWGRAGRATGRAAAEAGPRLRSGTQMQFLVCEARPAYEAPPFLGPHSRQALEDINRILASGDALSEMIVIGTAVTIVTSTPAENLAGGSYDVTPQAQALRAVPVIVRARVIEVISLLLLQHENDMNEQERQFWNNILRQFNAL